MLWEDITSLVDKRFEVDILNKEFGLIKTKWDYRLDGKKVKDYRTRVTLKISQKRKKIEIKAEEERPDESYWDKTKKVYMKATQLDKIFGEGDDDDWVQGCDTVILETVRRDLQRILGN